MDTETNGHSKRPVITADEASRMAELAAMGMPHRLIAKETKRSVTSVHRVLSKKAKPVPKKKAAKAPAQAVCTNDTDTLYSLALLQASIVMLSAKYPKDKVVSTVVGLLELVTLELFRTR